ncbi:PhzF family phenazine biosynthesis protein [Ahrensia sp. R2A130]|uniref:PhzF family phenazine biosynthesis protein n=1 Tax=Ahrensia sp. R2A130 TaxID=744979 RepID=UPI0001E0B48C|nr:PhzF family phenazine biosynthesis protein [Ahrensia sp. R2A130]EFL90730.1 PhzF family phenazine biosynthesis protein [Ahrensia sp. R2A130]
MNDNRGRRFAIYDVFSAVVMGGNQLGVVFDSKGLDKEKMQAIAKEFGFSETVFLFEAEDAAHSAKVRIYTPARELPFAGHPTVGAAIAVARERGMEQVGQGIVVLEENVGPVRCGVRFDDIGAFAEFDVPVLASSSGHGPDKDAVAAALSIGPHEVGFENHETSEFNGGLPYEFVPVRDRGVLDRVKLIPELWSKITAYPDHDGVYVYCRDTVNHDSHFQARMFAPGSGIAEDAATGSAVSSFAGVIMKFDRPRDGSQVFNIEQGFQMGRPSIIRLEIDVENRTMTSARIGGYAVRFGGGVLEV